MVEASNPHTIHLASSPAGIAAGGVTRQMNDLNRSYWCY